MAETKASTAPSLTFISSLCRALRLTPSGCSLFSLISSSMTLKPSRGHSTHPDWLARAHVWPFFHVSTQKLQEHFYPSIKGESSAVGCSHMELAVS
jgi:hypothetical protein